MTNEGVNYDVHDFPSSELGLKLGGYMMLSSTETILDEHSDSDVDVDMTTLNRPHNFRHHPEVTNTFLFNFSFKVFIISKKIPLHTYRRLAIGAGGEGVL